MNSVRGDYLPTLLLLPQHIGIIILAADVLIFISPFHRQAASHHRCLPINTHFKVVGMEGLEREVSRLDVLDLLRFVSPLPKRKRKDKAFNPDTVKQLCVAL